MRAPLIQRNIKHLAETLTSLYNKQSGLRAARKKFNERADVYDRYANNAGLPQEAIDAAQEAEDCREQAALYTPEIKRLKGRITGLEQVQKALKHDLKCAQCQDVCGEDSEAGIWVDDERNIWFDELVGVYE